MTAINLRFARDSDADGLIALISLCFSEYPGVLFDLDGELPELRAIQTYFEHHGGQFWVGESEQKIVACIGWTPSVASADAKLAQDTIELRKLYVHPIVRRQGLGARLCTMIEDVARSQRKPFVELWSDTKFVDAHRLYESRGYRRGGTRELHDLSNTVEYYYRKQL